MSNNNNQNNGRPAQIAQLIEAHADLKHKIENETSKIITNNPEKSNQVVKSWLLEK